MYGLLDRDISYIVKAVQDVESIKSVILFGSRAMGNYKKGSDIDLALVGEGITQQEIYKVFDLLNEVYPVPYFFDIVHYENITNEELRTHINTLGKVIWGRS